MAKMKMVKQPKVGVKQAKPKQKPKTPKTTGKGRRTY